MRGQRSLRDGKTHLGAFPLASFRGARSSLERRVSHEGMVSVGGNLYSVPDATRKRIVEVHTLAKVQIFGDGTLIAIHPVLDGAGNGGLRWAIPRCALPVVNSARNLLRNGAAKFPAWLDGDQPSIQRLRFRWSALGVAASPEWGKR